MHHNPRFNSFPPNETGHLAATPSVTALCAAVQPHFIPLQNFSFCAIAYPLQSPAAPLGCRFVCTTSGIAQKKNTKPVGGRGISAFSARFFFGLEFSPAPDDSKQIRLHWRALSSDDKKPAGCGLGCLCLGAFRLSLADFSLVPYDIAA